jgi:hypothetical protein
MLTSKGNIVAEKFFPQTSKSGAGIGRFKSVGSVIRSEVGGGAANPARHPHRAPAMKQDFLFITCPSYRLSISKERKI